MGTAGNPTILATGTKVDQVTDYASADGNFRVDRYYRASEQFADMTWHFGRFWRGLYPLDGQIINLAQNALTITLTTAQGTRFDIFYNSSTQTFVLGGNDANKLRANMTPLFALPASANWVSFFQTNDAAWRVTFGDGESFVVATSGASAPAIWQRVVPIEHRLRGGYVLTFAYAPATNRQLASITGADGRQLTVNQAGGVVTRIDLPDATYLDYSYGSNGRGFRLVGVARRSQAGASLWQRDYLYENPNQPDYLTGMRDSAGQRLSTYAYDLLGRVTESGRADGSEKLTFTYSLNGPNPFYSGPFSTSVTNAVGQITTHTFGAYSIYPRRNVSATRVDRVATANVPADALIYNAHLFSGNLNGTTDRNGRTTNFGYDGLSRPTSVTLAAGTPQQRVETTSWDATLDLPTQTVRPGLTVNTVYDSLGRLTSRSEVDTTTQSSPYSTNGQTRTWAYTWTALGKLASVNGPKPVDGQGRDDITTYTYDSANNLTATTNALGHAITYSLYDANGRPGRMTDANGVVTDFTYDGIGRVLTRTVKHPTDTALDAVTAIGYDADGRVTSIQRPATEILYFDYSTVGRLVAVRAPNGDRIDYGYNLLGQVTSETTKRANGTVRKSVTRTFDDIGRMLTETLGPGRTSSFAYDKNGNTTGATNALSQATTFAFDALNRLTSQLDPLSNSASDAYDGQDRPTTHTDKKAVQTLFVRNGFGDVIRETSPDRGVTVMRYDLAGDLTQRTDGRGQIVDYDRDILGRVTAERPAGKPAETIAYTYDQALISGSFAVGRLSKLEDGSGSTLMAYDHRGNLVAKQAAIGTWNGTTGYAYDLADRTLAITYPSGRIVDYARDARGRVSGVTTRADAAATPVALASAVAYEAFGQLLSASFGNGLTLAQDWGTDERLYGKTVAQGGTALWSKTYSYDGDDNLTAIADAVSPSASAAYSYDALSRLTRADGLFPSAGREDYNYDANGNRLQLTRRNAPSDLSPALTAISAIQSGTNRLTSVDDGGGVRGLTYDGRGNITGETRPGGIAVTNGYDGYGRLVSAARTGEATWAMLYNGIGDRVQVTAGSNVRRFVYDERGRLLGEYGTSTTDIAAEHVWLDPDEGYEPLALIGATTISWVHGDHLGTPALLTDASGNIANSYQAWPFGQRTQPLAAPTTAMSFPGQVIDTIDRHYNRARDYDPTIGRYLQADPIGLTGGDNLYGYVEQNPVRWIDPSGLNPIAIAMAVCADGGCAAAISATLNLAGIAVAKVCLDDDECAALYRDIDRLVSELKRRAHDLSVDRLGLPPTGRNSIAGHQQQFRNKQQQLRSLLLTAVARNCSGYRKDAWQWATRGTASK